jgi:type IV secretory pathway VirB6-like protein
VKSSSSKNAGELNSQHHFLTFLATQTFFCFLQAYYYRIAAELSSSALHDQVDEKALKSSSAGAAGAAGGYSRGVLGGGDAKVGVR